MNATPHLRPVVDALPVRKQSRWTDTELMATQFPEPRWAVPGLLCEGLNILAGAPKLGKSWLSLGLGASISTGEPALGSIDVEQGAVLYCALEDTGRRLQRRRRHMLKAGGTPSPLLTLETSCPVMTAGGDAVIIDWLEANQDARLVIIDTFEKMRGTDSPGISAYAGDYQAAGRFKVIADHYEVPILLIHHVRKQGHDDWSALVSGTNGLTGAADSILVLERGRGEDTGVLHVTGRDVEETDYAMRFDSDTGAWSKLDGPAEDYLMADTRAQLIRYLRDFPGSKPADIAEVLGIKPATVRKTLTRMAGDGQVRNAHGAYYPPGDTTPTQEVSPLSLCHSTPFDQGERL